MKDLPGLILILDETLHAYADVHYACSDKHPDKERRRSPRTEIALAKREALYGEFAQWWAVVAEALPGLREELQALRHMQAACEYQGVEECCLGERGLARLEYLRGILEGEEG